MMWQSAHDAYLESRVFAADPVELIGLLYQACTASVRDARRHLAEGEIALRSQAISRAIAILIELSVSLDARGGEVTVRLEALYAYMQNRLQEANCQQSDAPLAEVLGLLGTLGEGWEGVRTQLSAREEAANVWAGVPAEPAPALDHAWSF